MSLIVVEYLCSACHRRIEAIEPRGEVPDAIEHCGARAPRVPSAVFGRLKYGAEHQGRNEERPSGVLDTSGLADGMSMSEWKASIDDRGQRMDEHRAAMGIDPQVFV